MTPRPLLDVRPAERLFAALMCLHFFLVITAFWILKPVKKALFIQHYDEAGFALGALQLSAAQAELLAKVANMGVALAATLVFALAARRLRRERLSAACCGLFLVGFAVFAAALRTPQGPVVWSFYLFGDLFSTLMVAAFFAFLNDSVTPEAARRLYGPVGLGGVTGGVFGSTVVRAGIERLEPAHWLLVCLGLGLAIAATALAAGRARPRGGARESPPLAASSAPRASAFEGARLVARSSYLLSLVAIVGLYEIVSTVMDFQFTSAIAHYLDGAAIGRQFSTVFAITNVTSLAVQLLVTPLVLTRFGVGAALLILPAAILLGSAGFLLLPVLWMGSALNTLDNGFSYSIQQSSKEALYVPTSREEKYQAKAFIDMFVMRSAKAVAVGVSLLLTTRFEEFASVRWLSLFVIAVVALWGVAARHAGRRFGELTGGPTA